MIAVPGTIVEQRQHTMPDKTDSDSNEAAAEEQRGLIYMPLVGDVATAAIEMLRDFLDGDHALFREQHDDIDLMVC